MRQRSLGFLLAGALLLSSISAGAASFPPGYRFRSVSNERVTVHYHQGLEAQARQAAALASEILVSHERRYGLRVGRVQIVLADSDDEPNGFASPLPYPLVHIRAAAPDGSDDFGNYEAWLRIVLTHELAHVVHLAEARGLIRAGRKVFGRAPFLFPNTLTPTWMVEGLATYEETEGTAFGRGRSPDTRMVLRMAALEDDFPGEDRPVLGLDRWPAGNGSYLFGEALLRDMTRRFGERTIPELARVHAGRPIPFVDDLTSHKVTGASFHTRWSEWAGAMKASAGADAARIRARGLTASAPVTRVGFRQGGPRFSPGGEWIAYTSRTLTRYRAIRLVRPDGTGERKLTDRNGGSVLSWTPDGRTIVFDEPEVHGFFATRSDLRAVDVPTGRVRRLSRGLRARDPDVGPDGRTIVFVRRFEDRSELWTIGIDGNGPRAVTSSAPGTEWSGPRWSPGGDVLVASRFLEGGWLDIVTVDPSTGAVTSLTEDRAKDVEPAWTPDGRLVLFRSDRDGVSNLYALRVSDSALFRASNVIGGAFEPDVAPDGRRVVFSSYSARGYDIHLTEMDVGGLPPAEPFVDPYGNPRPAPEPVAAPDRPYRPLPAMLPRFWSPYAVSTGGEYRLGAATAGADPLLRHIYGAAVFQGTRTKRTGFQGFYQYDRFRPTLLATAEDETERETAASGRVDLFRTRKLTLRLAFPLQRRFRSSQSVSLAWRRERQTQEGVPDAVPFDLGGLEAAWTRSTAKQYPYSISPVEGHRLRVAYLIEDPALGSDVALRKLTADARAYVRLFGEADTLSLRAGGGTTFGRPRFRQSYAVGGFPDGALFDVVGTNPSVLRGYPERVFRGRSFVHANAEYRVPLAHPQHGLWSLPVFLRHLHGAVFADAAHAWTGTFRLGDVKTSAGVALGTDVFLAHGLPITATAGVARGFAERGDTILYFRTGLAF